MRGRREYLKGALAGLAAVAIWAGWSVMTRLAVTSDLDALDIAALRSGVAGLLLLPALARRGLALDRLGWSGVAVIIVGQGAPYIMVAASGLRFAPAADQGALNPGCMPLFVALLGAIVLRERPSTIGKAGLSLIVAGAAIIVAAQSASTGGSLSRVFGDALFLLASLMTAGFTVTMRQAKLAPLHAAAIVSVGSLALYAPVYLALRGAHLARLPLGELAAQAAFQGIVVSIVALLLYGRAVALLGASGGAAFGALVPALSALLAIPLLREMPTGTVWVAIAAISLGVYLASGGPLPTTRARRLKP